MLEMVVWVLKGMNWILVAITIFCTMNHFLINIFHIVHNIGIKHLEMLGTKLEDYFGSVPEQRLLRTKMWQRTFRIVMFQLLKEEVNKTVTYNFFEQKNL